MSEQRGTFGDGFLHGRDLLGIAGIPGLAVDGLDVFREGGVVVRIADVHLTFAIQAASGGDAFAVPAVIHGENTSGHRGVFFDQIRIVPDATAHQSEHAINLRRSIRATHQHFITHWIAGNGGEAAFEAAGRDGG